MSLLTVVQNLYAFRAFARFAYGLKSASISCIRTFLKLAPTCTHGVLRATFLQFLQFCLSCSNSATVAVLEHHARGANYAFRPFSCNCTFFDKNYQKLVSPKRGKFFPTLFPNFLAVSNFRTFCPEVSGIFQKHRVL